VRATKISLASGLGRAGDRIGIETSSIQRVEGEVAFMPGAATLTGQQVLLLLLASHPTRSN
jgi:hypothetical protein